MSCGLGFLRCSSVARSMYVEVCTHGEKMKDGEIDDMVSDQHYSASFARLGELFVSK